MKSIAFPRHLPPQVVLTVSQMMWCKDATVALTHEGDDLVRQEKMKEFEQKAFYDLNKLAEVVRGDLLSLTRAILCALITVGERFCKSQMGLAEVSLTTVSESSIWCESSTILSRVFDYAIGILISFCSILL